MVILSRAMKLVELNKEIDNAKQQNITRAETAAIIQRFLQKAELI